MPEQYYNFPRVITETTSPTVNDDETYGFIAGQWWINTTTGEVYVCVSNTNAAARWNKMVSYVDPNEDANYQTYIDNTARDCFLTPTMVFHDNVINYNITIPASKNAMTAGPITVTGSVTSLGNWTIC